MNGQEPPAGSPNTNGPQLVRPPFLMPGFTGPGPTLSGTPVPPGFVPGQPVMQLPPGMVPAAIRQGPPPGAILRPPPAGMLGPPPPGMFVPNRPLMSGPPGSVPLASVPSNYPSPPAPFTEPIAYPSNYSTQPQNPQTTVSPTAYHPVTTPSPATFNAPTTTEPAYNLMPQPASAVPTAVPAPASAPITSAAASASAASSRRKYPQAALGSVPTTGPPLSFSSGQTNNFTQPQPQLQQQPQHTQPQTPYPTQVYEPSLTQQFQNTNINQSAGSPLPAAVNLLQIPIFSSEVDNAPEPRVHDELKVFPSPHANSAADFKCCTIGAFPQSNALLTKSKLPLGLVISPYRIQHRTEVPVPVINTSTIVRCRRCRTYINPFVTFVDQGVRWRCNMCFSVNEVPNDFDYDSHTQQRVDRRHRLELNHGVIEFVAPTEYMVRPPQPPVFVFIIDVSYLAVSTGMLATGVRAILDSLDSFPNQEKRTKVGFITVDSTLHFYNLNPELSQPQMLVVSDLEDVFLPRPEDLLVNLADSREIVDSLLQKLPDMFKATQNTNNALGPALQAASKLLAPIGGKICVLQTILPNIGIGALKNREDPKILDTPKETSALEVPGTSFYKTLAVDCSRTQISIDFFLFPQGYVDIATFDVGPHFTGGCLYVYPHFNSGVAEDVVKFATDFSHYLSRPLGLEAVMRVRASKGIRMSGFHGNFFIRSMDLLALPAVSPDNAYAYQLAIEENIAGPLACFQTALLYTTSFGERRIRVLTLALPVTTNLADLYSSASAPALANLLSKMAVERALASKLEDARDALVNKLIELLQVYKSSFATNAMASQVLFPENLRHLALMILSMTKHIALRAGTRTSLDERATAMAQIRTMPLFLSNLNFLPRVYALHTIDGQIGVPGDNGEIVMPPVLRLSSEILERHGVYLGDDGVTLYLWVSRAVAPEVCQQLFGSPSYESVASGKASLPALNTWLSQRVQSIIGKIRETRPGYTPLLICKEDQDPALRSAFLNLLVEDKTEKAMSYIQFLNFLREKVNSS